MKFSTSTFQLNGQSHSRAIDELHFVQIERRRGRRPFRPGRRPAAAPAPSRLTKTNPCQISLRNGFRKNSSRTKALGLVHLRTGLELAVEFEGPRVIRTEKKPRVAAVRLAVSRLGRAVAVVAEALRHDVHRPVRTDAREHADGAVLAMHDDERFAEQIEIQKIAGLRESARRARRIASRRAARGRVPSRRIPRWCRPARAAWSRD